MLRGSHVVLYKCSCAHTGSRTPSIVVSIIQMETSENFWGHSSWSSSLGIQILDDVEILVPVESQSARKATLGPHACKQGKNFSPTAIMNVSTPICQQTEVRKVFEGLPCRA